MACAVLRALRAALQAGRCVLLRVFVPVLPVKLNVSVLCALTFLVMNAIDVLLVAVRV
jgi:hypothetical protein